MEQFIKILEIIAWPSVALVAMFFFKKDLSNVLRRLTKVETSAAKMMFNEEIKEVESTLLNVPDIQTDDSSSWVTEMNAIAKINPRAAIMESWTSIEIACVEIGMVQGSIMPRFSPRALEEFLHKIPDFDKGMIKRVMDLRRLRNRVTHGMDTDFDFIDAEKYIELADKTLSTINAANKSRQQDALKRDSYPLAKAVSLA